MNLATFATIIQAAPALLGIVNNTVHEVETMVGQLPGAQKFAGVEAKVNSFLNACVQDAETLTNLQAIVPTLINASVAMFNAAGVFGHKAQAAQAPAA